MDLKLQSMCVKLARAGVFDYKTIGRSKFLELSKKFSLDNLLCELRVGLDSYLRSRVCCSSNNDEVYDAFRKNTCRSFSLRELFPSGYMFSETTADFETNTLHYVLNGFLENCSFKVMTRSYFESNIHSLLNSRDEFYYDEKYFNTVSNQIKCFPYIFVFSGDNDDESTTTNICVNSALYSYELYRVNSFSSSSSSSSFGRRHYRGYYALSKFHCNIASKCFRVYDNSIVSSYLEMLRVIDLKQCKNANIKSRDYISETQLFHHDDNEEELEMSVSSSSSTVMYPHNVREFMIQYNEGFMTFAHDEYITPFHKNTWWIKLNRMYDDMDTSEDELLKPDDFLEFVPDKLPCERLWTCLDKDQQCPLFCFAPIRSEDTCRCVEDTKYEYEQHHDDTLYDIGVDLSKVVCLSILSLTRTDNIESWRYDTVSKRVIVSYDNMVRIESIFPQHDDNNDNRLSLKCPVINRQVEYNLHSYPHVREFLFTYLNLNLFVVYVDNVFYDF